MVIKVLEIIIGVVGLIGALMIGVVCFAALVKLTGKVLELLHLD